MKIHALVIAFATLGLAAHADAAQLKPAQQVKANTIIKKVIPAYYGGKLQNFGIVTAIGKPRFSTTKTTGVVKASGQFNSNMLWGGAVNYRYSVDVNLKTGLIKQLKQPVETRVTN
jgi:hypothetical protein